MIATHSDIAGYELLEDFPNILETYFQGYQIGEGLEAICASNSGLGMLSYIKFFHKWSEYTSILWNCLCNASPFF